MSWLTEWLEALYRAVVPATKESQTKWFKQTYEDLKREEGCSLSSYWDPIGKCWTIGYGHTSDPQFPVSMGMKITQAQAEQLLERDLNEAVVDVRSVFSTFDSLDWVRKSVLLDMAFNLGGDSLGKFNGLIKAVKIGDYNLASLHMANSLWAKQVKQRATKLVNRMRTGTI